MPLVLDGTNGVSGVDGTASNPAIEGTDSNTGIFYPAADTVAIGTGGTEALRIDSARNMGLGVTPSAWGTLRGLQVGFANFSGVVGSQGMWLSSNAFYNGSNWIYQSNSFATFSNQQNGAHTWHIAPSGTAGNAITFTQAMTLDASGNLIVGGTSASGILTLGNSSKASTTAISVKTSTGDNSFGTQFGAYGALASGDAYIYAPTSGTSITLMADNATGTIKFASGGNTERARITSGGEFLVGTTSSGGKITVNDGNVHINWGGGYFNSLDRGMTIVAGGYNDTTNKARVVHVGGVGDNGNRCGWTAYGIKTGGTGNGSQYYLRPVTWSGSAFAEQGSAGVYLADNATSWTSASDERLKDIIEPITDAANKVASLRAVIGKYKTDDEGTRRTFLIAQDVQAVLPEAVDANNPDELGLAYTDTIPLLVAAIKELNAKVEAQAAEIAALKAQP